MRQETPHRCTAGSTRLGGRRGGGPAALGLQQGRGAGSNMHADRQPEAGRRAWVQALLTKPHSTMRQGPECAQACLGAQDTHQSRQVAWLATSREDFAGASTLTPGPPFPCDPGTPRSPTAP